VYTYVLHYGIQIEIIMLGRKKKKKEDERNGDLGAHGTERNRMRRGKEISVTTSLSWRGPPACHVGVGLSFASPPA
jgi:hypothetical protein